MLFLSPFITALSYVFDPLLFPFSQIIVHFLIKSVIAGRTCCITGTDAHQPTAYGVEVDTAVHPDKVFDEAGMEA